ncbi:MAG: 5-oxoprolinase subunit PxpB [Deltaproteobacteria bacterium]|jgi:KipI family sensor histidine kinase inhibitor|nr:5-oxoprolinase subunit PxpB [Deltaproteobacteria bacterium]MBW2483241.1 5-oxoprolinase subunit PxpB [Deltaproteobacteria bacterium]
MGDRSLLVELGDDISPAVNQCVQELFTALDMQPIDGVRELVPSYRSLLVIYEPLKISPDDLKRAIGDTYDHLNQTELPEPRTIDIPIVYGGEQGPDLAYVAQHHHITPQEVIDYHTRPTYRVYMIGFTPGYPYLGEVPDAIATPRRTTPRILVPKGSVGIAQKQTGIYSVDSPGGWQIIGWTPVNLFDPQAQPPSLLMMGDRVRFQAITLKEAFQWQAKRL